MSKIETRLQEVSFLILTIVAPFLLVTGVVYLAVDNSTFALLLGNWGSRQIISAFDLLGYAVFLLPLGLVSFASFFIARFKTVAELRDGYRGLFLAATSQLIFLVLGATLLGILESAHDGAIASPKLLYGWGGHLGLWIGVPLFQNLGLMGSLVTWALVAVLSAIVTGHLALVNAILSLRETTQRAGVASVTFARELYLRTKTQAATKIAEKIEERRLSRPLRLKEATELGRAVNDSTVEVRRPDPSQFKIIVNGKTLIQPLPVLDTKPEPAAPKAPKTEKKAKEETPAPEAPAIEAPAESAPPSSEPQITAYRKKYALPSETLLNKSKAHKTLPKKVLEQKARELEERLKSFGIDGKITGIHPGVRLTMFEYAPDSGMKVSKIQALTTDLALLLGAPNIRMLAPIPGKTTIGFEIPNEESSSLGFASLLPHLKKARTQALPVAMGMNVYNDVVISDLAAMPHVLVSGTTGSGKSVFMNSLINSLLFTRSPKDLRLLMIDPKMIELTPYNGIPHLLLPVVSDVEKAKDALVWAEQEMDRRYQAFAELGARNITSFNEQISKQTKAAAERRTGRSFAWDWVEMPYIVVIVDELADLMITQGKLVEIPITRIAQKARACGIHLVLSTQRPSSEIVTGLIKTNFPTRIAFKVSSSIDSRTILDTAGAEALLGNGDMLYKPNGKNIERLQASFISEAEVNRVVGFIKGE